MVFLAKKIKRRELKPFCRKMKVSYTYVWKIVKGERNPTVKLIKSLEDVIPPDWWF
jgi:transcriptional regulator with XRE-family HTH domain